ncbi:lytic polysaccharide monooxygenase [Xylariomycetidae sp. FL2044]|nr:lytic polysaccharide monooxygenase [Xylariomycetidae sp. FL2044]
MPSKITSTILAAVAGAASVSAHGHVSKITVDGVDYDGFDPTSAPYTTPPDSIAWSNGATDNGFVLSSALQTDDIICHLDAGNAALTAPATAGSDVTITWNTWPESHKGPVIDYLADCGTDCSTVDKTTLKWFKIAEMGQLELGSGAGQMGRFASDELIDDSFSWTVTLPSSLAAGNYVWRHEMIALHEAGTEGKAQMYPQCFNIAVSGSGTQSPDGVVGTSLYTSTDPGILHNIYNDESLSAASDYIIPGPELASFDGSASSGGDDTAETPAATSTSAAAVATSTTAAAAATTTAAAAVETTSAAAPATTTTSSAAAVATSTSAAAATPSFHCNGKRKRHHARHLKNLH